MHTSPIDLGVLRALDALLEERHVSRAAGRVGLTQSAMSRVLARLRSDLDDPLLVRSGRVLVLSPRAERMQGPLRDALTRLAHALADEQAFSPRTSQRRFRIATVDYGAAVALLPLLGRLSREAPRIEIAVEPLRADFELELESGGLDLVLAPRRKSSAGLIWTKLRSERFVTVTRRGHPKVKRKLDLDLYCALSHVVVVPERRAGSPVDTLLAERGRTRHVALRVPSFLLALLAVAESDLVLTTPESLARRHAEGLALDLHAPPFPLAALGLSLVWHERQRSDAGHRFLRALIVETLRGKT